MFSQNVSSPGNDQISGPTVWSDQWEEIPHFPGLSRDGGAGIELEWMSGHQRKIPSTRIAGVCIDCLSWQREEEKWRASPPPEGPICLPFPWNYDTINHLSHRWLKTNVTNSSSTADRLQTQHETHRRMLSHFTSFTHFCWQTRMLNFQFAIQDSLRGFKLSHQSDGRRRQRSGS